MVARLEELAAGEALWLSFEDPEELCSWVLHPASRFIDSPTRIQRTVRCFTVFFFAIWNI